MSIGFPNHIQRVTNMHFNTLLFSTHKAVITLRGVPNKHCLLTLLVLKIYVFNILIHIINDSISQKFKGHQVFICFVHHSQMK